MLLCDAHGETDPCMVCCHLVDGPTLRGFNTAQDPNPDPEWAHLREAWCNRCDWWGSTPRLLRQLYNWWVGPPHMVCTHCFARLTTAHRTPKNSPGWWER